MYEMRNLCPVLQGWEERRHSTEPLLCRISSEMARKHRGQRQRIIRSFSPIFTESQAFISLPSPSQALSDGQGILHLMKANFHFVGPVAWVRRGQHRRTF